MTGPSLFPTRRRAQEGQGALEYVVILTFLFMLLIAAIQAIGHRTYMAFCQASNGLHASGCTFNTWGFASNGQLGNGQFGGTSSSPVNVNSIPQAQAIAAGGYHSLAVQMDNTVWSWGDNGNGQLGNGTVGTDTDTPSKIPGLSSITQVAAGGYHSLALRTPDGSLWAWGYNLGGQLGLGTTTDASVPTMVTGMPSTPPVQSIAAGFYHSYALKSDGTVWAWGNNDNGQLGQGTQCSGNPCVGSTVPIQVPGLSGMTAISGGGYFGAAIKSDGTLWMWGDNGHGQLGDGTTIRRLSPQLVPGMTNVAAVSTGLYHTLTLKTDGTVWSWGLNDHGQLGDGTTTQRVSPVLVGSGFTSSIGTGEYFSFATKTDGSFWSWGDNSRGQLGVGNICSPNPCGNATPTQVPGIARVTEVSGGAHHTMVLSNGG